MIVLSYVYWSKKHITELISVNVDINSDRSLRLVNYLIDSSVIGLIAFGIANQLNYNNIQIDYLYVYLGFIFIYYFCCELVFRQTLGKVITNSVVRVNSDNYTKAIFIRSISRLIPFEPLSFVIKDSEGWHDKLSKTSIAIPKAVQIGTHRRLNYAAITILFILGIYMLLIYSDSPMSWKIPEQLILCLPVFFLIVLILSIASLSINKNITAIITTVISIIFLILTLLFTLFLMNFKYQI